MCLVICHLDPVRIYIFINFEKIQTGEFFGFLGCSRQAFLTFRKQEWFASSEMFYSKALQNILQNKPALKIGESQEKNFYDRLKTF